jgi:hypothetical protein
MFDYEKDGHTLCDATGRRVTVGLFKELADPASAFKPPFTLKEWRKRYVAIADPTDYKAAMELLGDWEHWQLLMSKEAFAKEVAAWREEVHIKLKSLGIEEMKKQAKTPKGTAAAKWLAENGVVPKNRVGRPNKELKDDSNPSRARDDARRLSIVK